MLEARLFLTGWELGVGVPDRERVVGPRSIAVRVGEVEVAAGDTEQGGRVVHHRRPAVRRGQEIVRETEGVADLVGSVLAAPRHRERLGARVRVEGREPVVERVVARQGVHLPLAGHRDGPRIDVVVAERAVRLHTHGGLDDLPRARIHERRPDRVARFAAVHPLDHVVTGVHRVHVGRHVLDAERVLEPGRFQHLVPPRRPLPERRAVGLGHTRVEIVHDRLYGRARGHVGVLLDEPVANGVAHDEVAVERLRVVVEGERKDADTGIEPARPEAGSRELHEGEMLTQGDRPGVGGEVIEE